MSQNQFPRSDDRVPADLKVPVRNRYFYGKLLDVQQLELEQEYFNAKRWLLNRLVTGPGVVCGLRVELTDDRESVIVRPGLAIDRCGHEILVTGPSRPVPLPPRPTYDSNKTQKGYQGRAVQQKRYKTDTEHERHNYCQIPFAHVLLCYHECESDPVPAMAGDCEAVALCASGSIREQYRIEVKPGFATPRRSAFPTDIVEDGEINYARLVDYVTNSCRRLPDDCCLPLANIELMEVDDGWSPDIDNGIRPIVYTNRLLFHLIDSLVRGDEAEEESEV
ncbi:MAG TPA: hypothetical protein VMZ30_18270 [Pyrinomonadaceae bacterium]|nr:hypothetical protein [Pyrinomonadaceae bacterium]